MEKTQIYSKVNTVAGTVIGLQILDDTFIESDCGQCGRVAFGWLIDSTDTQPTLCFFWELGGDWDVWTDDLGQMHEPGKPIDNFYIEALESAIDEVEEKFYIFDNHNDDIQWFKYWVCEAKYYNECII